ncbi:restriction endonuclease [Mesorhizobium sp.]|uniref:restriction endonuclease n=1 Tax=Mesorhizobium sp. TaxID=1871066 RepID=UPI000FEA3831|nr:restriction endonuclease [Mesorhizobium sp.]RWA66001.1 MAG: restriction endonuclease [Mesorhizobium sp.]RWA80829.1 MAG: restriction endonuclease [Mesorhizobium sp.]
MERKASVTWRSEYKGEIQSGELTARFSADGTRILRWYIDFRHKLLNVHKELSAPELFILQHKIDALMAQWDEKATELQRKQKMFASKHQAEQEAVEAAMRLEGLQRILIHTLTVNDRIDWNDLKDHSAYDGPTTFAKAVPRRSKKPEPEFEQVEVSFFDKLLGRTKKRMVEAQTRFESERAGWQRSEQRENEKLNQAIAQWTAEKAEFEATAERAKREFLQRQAVANQRIDVLAADVANGESQAVIEHASLVLDASDYDGLFEKSYEIDYSPSSKTLMVEYQLPSLDGMPIVKSVRFVAATGELKETYISEKEQRANYDSVCYQICLRTIHELLEADEFENIQNVLFNGISTFVDRTTGRDAASCILSVLVNRNDFLEIDLARVDPKACFKSLKGVSASSLAALAPIPPVMELNKEDRRFIDPRNVAETLDTAVNLASMDWGDFEHLVRELFEKEFASRGGEVKVTQSSSDGGVDAVAFDPDPITGGKIVIQAKRYTRTVGVSAVRDLYGTMQHEGASRGVLITTADYGPDAHRFATGKPITLFTGANLLHLLQKHGYNAKIDLREARKELNLREYGPDSRST